MEVPNHSPMPTPSAARSQKGRDDCVVGKRSKARAPPKLTTMPVRIAAPSARSTPGGARSAPAATVSVVTPSNPNATNPMTPVST